MYEYIYLYIDMNISIYLYIYNIIYIQYIDIYLHICRIYTGTWPTHGRFIASPHPPLWPRA